MKAIVIRQFGNPSVLSYEDVPDPEPGEGEVRIAVRAAGTNPVDAGNRADGTGAGITLPWVPGYELSGVIDRVGPATGNWKLTLGQRVVTMTDFPRQGGGYAELAVVAAGSVALLADSVPFAAAAATPVAGGTAWEILERLRLGAGARLLVLGSSGGVGSYLLQLAALRGIATVAVGRREQHERLRQLGAAACLDYVDGQGAEDLRRAGQGPVDAIADLAGGAAAGPWLGALRDGGQIASIATPELDLDYVVDHNVTFHGILLAPAGRRTRALAGLLSAGQLISQVAHLLPLAQAAQAHRLLETRHPGGKVVLATSRG
jgi:NADPH2:quinone reductase